MRHTRLMLKIAGRMVAAPSEHLARRYVGEPQYIILKRGCNPGHQGNRVR
ncbi:MAG TPA: hypothetical protein GXZ24_00740 [Firmicutes bacterium]|nr:hypothetical protein [Bacillota bacterium]